MNLRKGYLLKVQTQLNLMITKILIILFILTSNTFGAELQCKPGLEDNSPKRIAWFVSTNGTPFWKTVEKVITASAKDLGVILEVYFSTDPIHHIKKVKEVLNRKENPIQGVLFHNHKHRGEEVLKIIEEKGIPTIMFNAGFVSPNSAGKPREKYKCWIGTMFPNDEKSGYQLAFALLEEAKKHPNMIYDNKIHMVALEGDRASNASKLRIQGMNRALKEWKENDSNPQVILHQSFHSKWRRDLSTIAFKLTQSRYPKVSVFWTAADVMALGVIDGAKELGKIPGKDFVTGGMDLLPSTLEHLENGTITASVGAHYIEGAFALIALYDYLNGYDFASVGKTEFLTDMAIRSGKSKQTFATDEKIIKQRLDSVDFTLLSNAYKGKNIPYTLDTQAILNKLW